MHIASRSGQLLEQLQYTVLQQSEDILPTGFPDYSNSETNSIAEKASHQQDNSQQTGTHYSSVHPRFVQSRIIVQVGFYIVVVGILCHRLISLKLHIFHIAVVCC